MLYSEAMTNTETHAPRSPMLPRELSDYGLDAVAHVAALIAKGESPYCDMSDESMTVWADEGAPVTFLWRSHVCNDECAA